MVSNRVMVKVRSGTILWDTLRQALVVAQTYSSERAKLWPDLDMEALYGSKWDVMDSFHNTANGSGVRLLELLTSNKSKGATDPRDMVFALLGLSNDGHPHSFQPDNSKSVRQV